MDELYETDTDGFTARPRGSGVKRTIVPKNADIPIKQTMTNIFQQSSTKGRVKHPNTNTGSAESSVESSVGNTSLEDGTSTVPEIVEKIASQHELPKKADAVAADPPKAIEIETEKSENQDKTTVESEAAELSLAPVESAIGNTVCQPIEDKKDDDDKSTFPMDTGLDLKNADRHDLPKNDDAANADPPGLVDDTTVKSADQSAVVENLQTMDESTMKKDDDTLTLPMDTGIDLKNADRHDLPKNDDAANADPPGLVDDTTVKSADQSAVVENLQTMDESTMKKDDDTLTLPMDTGIDLKNADRHDLPKTGDGAGVNDEPEPEKHVIPESSGKEGDGPAEPPTEENRSVTDAVAAAKLHNSMADFLEYHTETMQLDGDEWIFGDGELSDPVEDLRSFNIYLMQQGDLPIPYLWCGRREGVLVANESTSKEDVMALVKQVESHPRFETYNNTVVVEREMPDFVFGKVNPVLDINFFNHWLLSSGFEPLAYPVEHTQPDLAGEVEEKEIQDTSKYKTEIEETDVNIATPTNSDVDSEDDDPEKYAYPPAPTCDHPTIRHLLKSAAKACGVPVCDVF